MPCKKLRLDASAHLQKHYNTPSKEFKGRPCIPSYLTNFYFKLFVWF